MERRSYEDLTSLPEYAATAASPLEAGGRHHQPRRLPQYDDAPIGYREMDERTALKVMLRP